MSDPKISAAARSALETHDALRATYDSEPPSDANGLPTKQTEWLVWFHVKKKPAFERWEAAMKELADVLGEPDMSRHPFTFRPRCEAILSEEVAAMRER